MLFNSTLLTAFQRCRRRYLLERDWRVSRWHPKELFQQIWRVAVFNVSNGADVAKEVDEACTQYLEECAKRGIETSGDQYIVARDFCAILSNSLEAISRLVLLRLNVGRLVATGPHEWQTKCFEDESGLLHHWIAVERWDEDAKWRTLHGWEVFGECAANRVGMSLHIIEIGRLVKGHQHSDWTRIYTHPAINNHSRFRHTDGSRLEGNWKPKWFQDSDSNTSHDWIDLMQRDRLETVLHLDIKEPSTADCVEFIRDLRQVHLDIERLPEDWRMITRERPQCDLPPCPWQDACYAPQGLVQVEKLGLYERRG